MIIVAAAVVVVVAILVAVVLVGRHRHRIPTKASAPDQLLASLRQIGEQVDATVFPVRPPQNRP